MRNYYPQLDGLRAIAIITVMMGHFFPYPWINNLVGWGDSGVVIFFCLSGFLITGILLDLRASGESRWKCLVTFYARRALRIFPIYYLVIAIAVVAGNSHAIRNLPQLLTYTANYVPGLPSASKLGPFSHVWSLSVEEQFYLLWPILIIFLPRRLLSTAVFVVVISSTIFKFYGGMTGANYSLIFKTVFSCMDSLAAGSMIALVRPTIPQIMERYGSRLLIASAVLVCVSTTIRIWMGVDPFYREHELVGVFYFQTIAILSCIVIIASVSGRRWLLAPFLDWWPLVRIGRISYGLYVYHFFMPTIAPMFVPLAIYNRYPVSTCVALSFAAAIISWIVIEKPILYARKFISSSPANDGVDRRQSLVGVEATATISAP
jgi:peptidoglycan/LPS O-acetylase OafA/YrhL